MGDMRYDALLLVSFGGPETRADVLPFLENVLRGRNVPRERMLEVAEHYYHFGGKSPINDQNRLLLTKIRETLNAQGPHLPLYWGNRNWQPYIRDAISQMRDDGIHHALAFVTSAYSSYSGCRQYREDIERAREAVGPGAPTIDKIRAFYNHPGFIEPMVESVATAINKAAIDKLAIGADNFQVIFTAHSIPTAVANTSRYREQIEEAARIVAETLDLRNWTVAWQSRSGPASQPWLEPDVGDVLRGTPATDVIIVPIGFISDHMEVLYDLDEEAREICEARGIRMIRAATVGTHPRFVQMIRELIVERMDDPPVRPALGILGPNHDLCPRDCCPAPSRPPQRALA
jgi:ferrochelatase